MLKARSYNLIKNAKNVNLNTIEKAAKFFKRIEENSKGRFYEKWINYWKGVYADYRDVTIDIKKDIKEKPLKALALFAGFSGIYYCVKHNPNERSFRDAYINAANQVLLVHPSCQKKETADHLKNIEIYYNNHLIRRLNCGVASIIWVDNYSNKCNTFEAQCTHLKVQYSKFYDRILDVGFLDNWWLLSNKMIDYDINY